MRVVVGQFTDGRREALVAPGNDNHLSLAPSRRGEPPEQVANGVVQVGETADVRLQRLLQGDCLSDSGLTVRLAASGGE